MQLADLIQGLNTKSIVGLVDREVTGVRYDSRRVTIGNLFVAVRGAAFDGHAFIEQAIDKGAVAVVGEQAALSQRATAIVVQDSREALAQLGATFFGNPSRKLKIIGVTGTNGKSTTPFLLKHLLERAGQSTGLIGTVQYEIGERLLPATRTTPESLDLQELLKQCVEAGWRNVVMEVSSHALSQGRADQIAFDAAGFTNLTQDHLDYHRGMKEYFEAKASLFATLSPKNEKQPVAVINSDDPYGQKLITRFGKTLTITTYGMGARAHFRASDMKSDFGGTSYRLDANDKSYLVRLPLIGRFNIYNSLAAIATARSVGLDVRNAVLALAKAPQIPGR